MSCIHRLARNSIALAVSVMFLGFAQAAPPEVVDGGGFFSAAAEADANARIRSIKQLYKKDIHIETFTEVPANLQAALQKDKKKTMTDWAASQAAKNKIDGVYVQICKDPPHLEVLVDNATLKRAFTAKDRDDLRDLLVASLRDKKYDQGLADAMSLARERFERNRGPDLTGSIVNSVQDHAGLFSSQQVVRANKEVKEFAQRFKRDLVIETFQAPPADMQKKILTANPEEKEKIFTAWIHARVKAAKADGIYVLICKDPPRLQVEVGDATVAKAFTAKDREHLVSMLIGHLKAKTYDKGLDETLDLVYDTVDRNLSPQPPAATAGVVKDMGNLFSPAAVQKANLDLQKLAKEADVTVTMETLVRVPAGQWKRVESMNPEMRNKFFADWLKERAGAAKADGVYLLICRQPEHIEIGVGNNAKGFTQAKRDELAKLLMERFKAKQFDQGLFQAVDFVGTTVSKTAVAIVAPVKQPEMIATPTTKKDEPVSAPEIAKKAVTPIAPVDAAKEAKSSKAGTEFQPIWILYGLAGLVALWLVIGILRAIFGSRAPAPVPPQQPGPQAMSYGSNAPKYPPPPGYSQPPPMQGGYPPPQPQSGGGFMPSLMGGLFGAAAGSFISDRFLRSGSAAPPMAPQHPAPSTYPPPVPPPYSDNPPPSPGYSSSGADFGDAPAAAGYSSSGADFGSPEPPASSGGDFGAPTEDTADPGWNQSPEPPAESSGGEFGAAPQDNESAWNSPSEPAPESSPADYSSPPPADQGWSQPPDPPAESSGGDFGG